MGQILEGVKVVEVAQYVFVPACGAILADLGAEVVKVEPPKGDPYRGLVLTQSQAERQADRKVNVIFELNNRGKRSLALDLKHPQGLAALQHLVDAADVFLTNFRPDALERLQLSAAELQARNPRLIYARGHGYGRRGPDAGKPGYDSTAFWARAGFGHILTPPDVTAPINQRGALGDHIGAMNLAMGVTSALFARERSGRGAVVDVSLLATGMWALSSDIVQSRGADAPKKEDRGAVLNPLLNAFRTSDHRWIQLIFLEPDRYWPGLCERLGRPDLATDPRFTDARSRAAHKEECVTVLREIFGRHTLAEWRVRLKDFDAPWEVLQSVEELLQDPQVIANNYITTFETETGESYRQVAAPVEFNETPAVAVRAPRLGEHTDEVLRQAGYSDEQIAALRQARVAA